MEKQTNPFELLLDDNIIAIFSGDCEVNLFSNQRMPFLNENKLYKIALEFNYILLYNGTRYDYLKAIIKHCINENSISELLSYLFDKSQFINENLGYTPEEINKTYNEIVNGAIFEINNILSYNDKKLVNSGGKYDIIPINVVIVDTPKIKTIDRDYILSTYQKAINDISEKNYDECLTKSRTLLEEVFCKVIEDKGDDPKAKGNINQLYKQVKNLYNMHGNKDMDIRINTLISGLETIVNSIAEIRNKASDAHGMGAKRFNILEHHSRLVLNSALTIAEFIYSVAENSNKT